MKNLFEPIADSYEKINSTLSFGLDRGWRESMIPFLDGKNLSLLDLATGTGSQLIPLLKSGKIKQAVGLDPSEAMLAHAKVAIKPWDNQCELIEGVAEKLPFEDKSFDVTTMSFGIRNVSDRKKAFLEMKRVTRSRILILEFAMPEKALFATPYRFYLNHILPKLGGYLSGDKGAYDYLAKSIQEFPKPKCFLAELHKLGFEKVARKPLIFGAVNLFIIDL